MARRGDRFPAALRPAHLARVRKEHEPQPFPGLGRELQPATAHGGRTRGRLDHHRTDSGLAKSCLRRPERGCLVTRPNHHHPVRIEAEIGKPGGIEGRKGHVPGRAPQDRAAQTRTDHRSERGGGRSGHRMHPPSDQSTSEPTVDYPFVNAGPSPFPAPLEGSDQASQFFPCPLHAGVATPCSVLFGSFQVLFMMPPEPHVNR